VRSPADRPEPHFIRAVTTTEPARPAPALAATFGNKVYVAYGSIEPKVHIPACDAIRKQV
jgi:hypothetical protein